MDTGFEKASGARSHRLGVWMAAGATLVAVACGGGGSGGVAGVGSGGTGFVTGFGSVIIDGIKYDDTSLDTAGNVRLEDSSTDGTVSNRSILKIGQRLEVVLSDDGSAIRSAVVASEITGPVTAAAAPGASSFVVAGQTVTVNTVAANGPLTIFEGASSVGDFAVGDRVEVHGDVLADGVTIRASRIERKPATTAMGAAVTFVKLSGLVQNPVSDAQGRVTRFSIGNITVNVAAGTPITPTPAVLTSGQRVKVFAPSITNNTVDASAVRVKRFNQDRADFRLRGLVQSSPAPTRQSFVINGVTVDASAANLTTDIVAGASYRVRGVYTAATNTLRVQRAEDVKRSDDGEVGMTELKGSVTDFVSVANFRVRGALVDASGLNPPPTLVNGDFVEVKGQPNAQGIIIASSVKRETAAPGNELELTGAISGLSTANSTFMLGSRLVSYTASTTFEDVARDQLQNGLVVEVEGRLNGSTLVARKIELKDRSEGARSNDNRGAEDREVEGRLANDAQTSGSAVNFSVSGVQLTCTSAMVGSACSAAMLRRGVEVEVRYTGNTAPFTVTRLKIED